MAKKTALTDKLERALQQKSPELYKRYAALKMKALDKLAPRQQNVENTEAGPLHVQTVHRYLSSLLPDERVEHLHDIELFCLLCAVYLHDIGRIREQKEGVGIHHSVIGRDIIIEHAIELGLEEPEALTVGYIVEGHGRNDLSKLCEIKGIAPFGLVRVRFLAALLRLADDLDMSYTRAPKLTESIVQPSEGIRGKWTFRQCIENIHIDPSTWTIEIQITPKDVSLKQKVLREIEIVSSRLLDSRPFLRAYQEIGVYYSLIDVSIDNYWIKDLRVGDEKTTHDEDISETVADSIPENTIAVLIRYDSMSIDLYKQIIAPTIENRGGHPVLIDELPAESTLLMRSLEVISRSKIVIALLSGSGDSSIFFRLGLSLGANKDVMLIAASKFYTIGDLCGLKVNVFNNNAELEHMLNQKLDKK